MRKGRLEAFSDGVIAIIITIMVLELKVPHGDTLNALRPLLLIFVSYILSFIYVGIYWNNHHHMLQAVERVNGRILWANLHLLFWLSLIPFASGWMGESHFSTVPMALYGGVLLMAGTAYFLLEQALVAHHGAASKVKAALGKGHKEIASVVIYALAIPLAFLHPWIAFALYVLVAILWLIPDRRFEKVFGE